MKILVVEDESVLRDLVSFMLESRFGGEILEASSGNRAIELLRNNPDIDLVICDYRMDDGTGGDVFRYLQEHHPSIKYILCTSGNPADYKEFQSSNAVIFFEKPFSADQLAEAIHRALGHEGDGALARPPRYCRIRTATILNVNLLSCDLYLKLSEGKYLKILSAGDVLTEPDVERYGAKNIDHLYVKHEDADSFLSKFTKDIHSVTRARQAIPHEAALLTARSTMEVIQEITHCLGFSREVQALAKASAELALRCMRDDPRLSPVLSKLSIDPESFICSHSAALAFVSCGIASLMSWNSDATRFKLALASFLHDLALTETEINARADSGELKDLDTRMSDKARSVFLAHPEAAAEFVRRMDDMPPDVDMILLQHHERPDGSGFPFQHNFTRLNALSSAFIVAHDLVSCCYRKRGRVDLKEFIASDQALFQTGHFRRLHEALMSAAR